MEKVLITGGTGFIGANFVHKFCELGYDVHIIVRKESNFWRINSIKDKTHIHYLDLNNYEKTESLLAQIQPEIILHFAAYGTYPRKQQDIKLTVDTNLLGTINLVNAASKIKFKCFINTGSSSEYGIKQHSMKEDELLEPNTLYGVTKAASTMYCQYMAKSLNLPIVTFRFFSVYGYLEEKERLIPTVIKACLTNSELKLSSPFSVRDYMFIEDAFDAYLKAIENADKIKGEVLNLSVGKQIDIAEIVNIITKITNSKIKPQYGQIKPAQTEPKTWVSDISKAKKLLNWQPRYDIETGLKKTVAWFKENMKVYENG